MGTITSPTRSFKITWSSFSRSWPGSKRRLSSGIKRARHTNFCSHPRFRKASTFELVRGAGRANFEANATSACGYWSGQLGQALGHCAMHELYSLQQTILLASHCWNRCKHAWQHVVDWVFEVGANSTIRDSTNTTMPRIRLLMVCLLRLIHIEHRSVFGRYSLWEERPVYHEATWSVKTNPALASISRRGQGC